MKYLVFVTASAIVVSNLAIASECAAARDSRGKGPTIVTSGAQKAGPAVELAMGPTSAARFQGGTGEASPPNPAKEHSKVHHRVRHQHVG